MGARVRSRCMPREKRGDMQRTLYMPVHRAVTLHTRPPCFWCYNRVSLSRLSISTVPYTHLCCLLSLVSLGIVASALGLCACSLSAQRAAATKPQRAEVKLVTCAQLSEAGS